MKKLLLILGILGVLVVQSGCNNNQTEQQQEEGRPTHESGSSGATKR